MTGGVVDRANAGYDDPAAIEDEIMTAPTKQVRTPGPWLLEHDARWMWANVQRADKSPPCIAKGIDPADAAFIVRACNAHDDLIAALQTIAARAWAGVANPHEDLGKIAQAALTRAEE